MLTAKEIMSKEIITVTAETLISKVAEIFHEKSISGVPVVDEGNEVIGIITKGDLIDQNKKLHIPTVMAILDSVIYLESAKHFEDDLKKMTGTTVGDICTKKVTHVSTFTTIAEIATIMAEKHFHTLPVIDDGKLVGIIGKDDIVKTMVG